MLFQLCHASFSYHDKLILDGISLSIDAGESVAVVGASGVGKSTLLRLLVEQHSDNIAYCTQDRELVSGLSSYNNIYLAKLSEFSAFKNILNIVRPNKQERQIIQEIAEQLQIAEKLDDSVNRLSGGQQQRVAIARAFYQARAVFVGDEPVSNLDALKSRAVIASILARHTTSIVALHDRELALTYFDRIVGIKQGKIVIDAASDKVTTTALESLYL